MRESFFAAKIAQENAREFTPAFSFAFMGFVFGGNDWAPFRISYRSFVPKASQFTNLLTATCPSSSHVGYGAIRLEWTFMALGQATGSAGVEELNSKSMVQDVKYASLRKQLLADKQVAELPASKKAAK